MMLMTKKHVTIQSDALRYGSVILIFLIAGILLLLPRATQYPEMIAMA